MVGVVVGGCGALQSVSRQPSTLTLGLPSEKGSSVQWMQLPSKRRNSELFQSLTGGGEEGLSRRKERPGVEEDMRQCIQDFHNIDRKSVV